MLGGAFEQEGTGKKGGGIVIYDIHITFCRNCILCTGSADLSQETCAIEHSLITGHLHSAGINVWMLIGRKGGDKGGYTPATFS